MRTTGSAASRSKRRRRAHLRKQEWEQVADLHPLLFHAVAIPQRHCVLQLRFLAERVEVDRHPIRRARSVLATITATDRATFIVEDVHVWSQKIANFEIFLYQLRFIFEQ